MVILISGIIFTLNAQVTPKVKKKQATQQARIQEGKRSGELTRVEMRQLQREQREINRHKNLAKADGKVTPRERKILRQEQKRSNRNIYRKKNNRRNHR